MTREEFFEWKEQEWVELKEDELKDFLEDAATNWWYKERASSLQDEYKEWEEEWNDLPLRYEEEPEPIEEINV